MDLTELKAKVNAKTSEELFGIDEQPKENCPKIDELIREWHFVKGDIEGYCKDLKQIDEASSIACDIEWSIDWIDIESGYEELREKCEDIRAWGQGWKDLAKQLLKEKADVSDLLADKFHTLLNTEI